MKTCKKCNIEKEEVFFDFNRKNSINRRKTCRKCRNEKNFGNYKIKHKDEYKEYSNNYYKQKQNDPIYKKYYELINIIRNSIKFNYKEYLIKNFDYSLEELIIHIETKFKNGMNWENYGKKWEIDHIITAIKMLRAGYSDKEINKLSNLRPLFIKENRSRSKKWDLEELEFFKNEKK